MAKNDKTSKASDDTATSATAEAGSQPQDVSVPVEGAAQATAAGETKALAKPAVPEHLKKGNRTCAACLTPEADFLAKNPRYSLCQGVDVLCYRKGHRVLYNVSLDDVNAKYPDKVGKIEDGKPLIEEVSGHGIKPGILVRGAISYKRKAVDTAATGAPASSEAAGSAPAMSGG